jgi:hypothetical protein
MVDEKRFEPSACPMRSDRSGAPQEEGTSRRTFGGREGIRTPGLLVANEALSQLSYSPTSSTAILANAQVLANTRSTALKQVGRSIPLLPLGIKLRPGNRIVFFDRFLRLLDRPARALRHDPLGILIQRSRLWNCLHGLLHLRISFQENFEPFLLAEG